MTNLSNIVITYLVMAKPKREFRVGIPMGWLFNAKPPIVKSIEFRNKDRCYVVTGVFDDGSVEYFIVRAKSVVIVGTKDSSVIEPEVSTESESTPPTRRRRGKR